MRVPHWWSRDRSSCRHLWYPITGLLRRNTPRIVHLPASVLENGASPSLGPSRARPRVSFRGGLTIFERAQGRVRRPPRFAFRADPRGEREIDRGGGGGGRPVARRDFILLRSRRMRSGRGTVASSAIPLDARCPRTARHSPRSASRSLHPAGPRVTDSRGSRREWRNRGRQTDPRHPGSFEDAPAIRGDFRSRFLGRSPRRHARRNEAKSRRSGGESIFPTSFASERSSRTGEAPRRACTESIAIAAGRHPTKYAA